MTRHDLFEWLAIIYFALAAWRHIDARWSLQILWGWRGQPVRCIKAWLCMRLTGVIPMQTPIDIRAHVAEYKLATIPWMILGSSK